MAKRKRDYLTPMSNESDSQSIDLSDVSEADEVEAEYASQRTIIPQLSPII